MISKAELLVGRDIQYKSEYTKDISDNLDKLLDALNIVRKAYGQPLVVSSGWRPVAINSSVGGAKKSNHTLGLACDFKDHDRRFKDWCLANLDILAKAGLYMEDPDSTPTWVHLQLKAPASGKRVFKP